MTARSAALLMAFATVACRGPHPSGHSAEAVSRLRAASEALRAYRAACDAYPATLEPLRAADLSAQGATCEHFGKLDGSIVDLVAAGSAPPADQQHALSYAPSGRNDRGFQRYQMEARWLGRTAGEHWSFWTSDRGVLTVAQGRPATESDPQIQ